jgi:hypothetical protein
VEDVPELLLLRGLSEEEEGTTAAPSPCSAQRTAANNDGKDGNLRQFSLMLRMKTEIFTGIVLCDDATEVKERNGGG